MNSFNHAMFAEYNSEITTAHHGGDYGRPFWNVHASQFMYNPCFQFAPVPGCRRYLFTVTDCNQDTHSFEADTPMSLLTPIWGDIPEGITQLKVEALNDDGKPWALVGGRTFFRLAPFAGKENYPPKARSYRDCALMAYAYIYSQPFIQHWLEHGTPDPDYTYNVYPSKTYTSVIRAMIKYARLEPAHADKAIRLAVNVADYLIGISFAEGTPLEGLPPTYYLGFREDPSKYDNQSAEKRMDNLMMIYPAETGSAYLELWKATGEDRFFGAAKKIADFYRDHVQPNGSWYLFLSVKTGENTVPNYCIPDHIMDFLHEMYEHTQESVWKELEQGCYTYMVKNCLEPYNWEGQFEDSPFSVHYSNLSNVPATRMVKYLAENKADDAEIIAEAEDLMRFIEDQFVVWGNFAPWNHRMDLVKLRGEISEWTSPAGLEQYRWAMPIDSSTASILSAFLALYKVNGKPALLEKACVLGDAITRMQNPKNGLIPTHWMDENCSENGGNFWINCMIHTANTIFVLAEATEKA